MSPAQMIQIEENPRDEDEEVELLRATLEDATEEEFTAADASAISGLPLDRCEPALLSLAQIYPSRLRVTEQGHLLFQFDSLLERRGPGTFARWIQALQRFWWRAYDAALGIITLVIAPVVLLTISLHLFLLAEVVRDWNAMAGIVLWIPIFPALLVLFSFAVIAFSLFVLFPVGAVTSILGGMAFLLFALLSLFPPFHSGQETSVVDMICSAITLGGIGAMSLGFGIWLGRLCYTTGLDILGGKKIPAARRLWREVGGFLFGPLSAPADPLVEKRRLTAMIREKKGVICRADLIELFGWDFDHADREITRILLDYGGDIEVTDDGAMLYHFDDLLASAGESETPVDTGPAYEREPEDPPNFFGLATGKAVLILLLFALGFSGLLVSGLSMGDEGFTLLAMGDVAFSFAELREMPLYEAAFAVAMISDYPYLGVATILLVRLPFHLRRRKLHRRRRRFLTTLRVATESPQGTSRIDEHLSRDVARLQGKIDVDSTQPQLAFPAIYAERQAATKAREDKKITAPGDVVFDTEAPDDFAQSSLDE